MADLEAIRDFPAVAFEACERGAGRASSTALVRYRLVNYSVPVAYAHRRGDDQRLCRAGRDRLRPGDRRPPSPLLRTWRGDLRPLHYLTLLEKKPGTFDQAAPLEDWKLDPVFAELCRLLEARFGHRGKWEYIQVLRLLEDFPEPQVKVAVREAVKRRLVGFDAVKHLLLARIERRPEYLDLSRYPHLPQPFVAATRIADYAALLARGVARG